jgi:hypothetical protein
MPQLVVIAVAGAALWAGYRWLARETNTIKDTLQAAEAELRRRAEEAMAAQTAGVSDADVTAAGKVDVSELPKLELDPASGEYRVKRS